MADSEEPEEAPKKKSKLPVILGLVLAIAGGGGGFFAASSGMLSGKKDMAQEDMAESHGEVSEFPDVAFVPLEPIIISLHGGSRTHLRFRAQLEVGRPHKTEVEQLVPRVVDVLNSYLRALDVQDLENNAALARLRAQMLRRVQIATGGGRVNDLLIMEFVLN